MQEVLAVGIHTDEDQPQVSECLLDFANRLKGGKICGYGIDDENVGRGGVDLLKRVRRQSPSANDLNVRFLDENFGEYLTQQTILSEQKNPNTRCVHKSELRLAG